jgi:hypothetical protein
MTMYRQLARWFQDSERARQRTSTEELQAAALRVFDAHPLQLARFLEEAWFMRTNTAGRPSVALPLTLLQNLDSGLGFQLGSIPTDIYPIVSIDNAPRGLHAQWNHLIYAYMIENTRIFEIMQRVIQEYLVGEILEVPSRETHGWLRATEDLFYRDAPSSQIAALTSWVRPDVRASRRGAYYRFFGMDLNHGTIDNRPYPFEKPKAANRDFVLIWEELLREVWKGIENSINTSGVNATDDAAIANLARQLFDMLQVRRRNGNLSREEFVYVTTLSWFHLTVEFDSPVVRDLKAEASSPEERLRKIGERVGLPAHAKSESYFILAEAMSRLLIGIETGQFNSPANVRALYAPPTAQVPNPLREDVLAIITHWSMATGRDLKAGKVTTSPRTVAPQAPTPRAPSAASANGSGTPSRVALPAR